MLPADDKEEEIESFDLGPYDPDIAVGMPIEIVFFFQNSIAALAYKLIFNTFVCDSISKFFFLTVQFQCLLRSCSPFLTSIRDNNVLVICLLD